MSAGRSSLLAFVFLLLSPLFVWADTVNVVAVSGGINPAVADYLQKAIDQSEREGAGTLVIELDTPGGLLSSTKDIVNAILNAEIPIIVFVSPRGAWAASAGTFITLSAHVAAMAPGTSIGAAHPVSFLPGTPPQPPVPDESGKKDKPPVPPRDIAGEKIENFTAAFIESIAEARKRNVEWAVEAVRNSVAITQSEALEKNVVDLVADDLDHLLELVDGRTVAVGRREVTLETKTAPIQRIEMELLNRIFNVIADPQIAVLLILAGLLGLYVEFTQPGMIFPGVAGVVSLILAGLALQIIPFNGIGLILILAGLVLLVAEIFVTSFGLLFTGGLICLAAGAYVLFDVPEESDLVVPFWRVIFPAVLAVATFGAVIVFGLSRSLFRPQFAGVEALVGEGGVVESTIRKRGRIRVRGELWAAEADENIPRGEKVKIVAVNNLVVRVVRDTDTTEKST
jgi:membrane-bound serine protease (ClpP class)